MRKKKNKKTVADTGYKKVDRKEKKKKEKQEEKRRQKKLSVQQSIAYKEMGRDGICRVQGKTYSKCIRFYDINYQLAQNEDKNAIFENWCDFLNYFDASIHFQLSFINHKSSMKEFEQVIRIRPQEDAFDDVRMEYAKMLKQQLAKGNNGLVKSKYITFSIEADNIREAYFFGGWDQALVTLIIFMAIDYISGLIVAGVFHNSKKTSTGTLESRTGWKGLCRKCMTLLFVLVAYRLDLAIGVDYIRDAVIIGFIANELISIVENAGLMGIPLPAVITNAIDILTQKAEKKGDA